MTWPHPYPQRPWSCSNCSSERCSTHPCLVCVPSLPSPLPPPLTARLVEPTAAPAGRGCPALEGAPAHRMRHAWRPSLHKSVSATEKVDAAPTSSDRNATHCASSLKQALDQQQPDSFRIHETCQNTGSSILYFITVCSSYLCFVPCAFLRWGGGRRRNERDCLGATLFYCPRTQFT